MPAPEKRNSLRWWRPVPGLQLSAFEAEAVDWALDGHNDAVDDENFHRDNPECGHIAEGTDPLQWPEEDASDMLYRLEVQAPEMSSDPEGVQWGRTCKRAARKIRNRRPDGATLEAR